MNDGFEPYHSLDGEPQFMITEEKLKEITKWKVCYQRLKKELEELIDRANYDELLNEPECQKVLMMDSGYYCECGYCMFGDMLQKILGEEYKIIDNPKWKTCCKDTGEELPLDKAGVDKRILRGEEKSYAQVRADYNVSRKGLGEEK